MLWSNFSASLLLSIQSFFSGSGPLPQANVIKPGDEFYLLGYPVAHSLSPAFHNEIFRLREMNNSYGLFSTSVVTDEVLDILKGEHFGGASVTMPLKTAIIPYLDAITPESKSTNTVNTIIKVSNTDNTGYSNVGTNTDILGIKNALIRDIRLQHPEEDISPVSKYSPGQGAAVIFGGGATTRSAIYALNVLGLHPIFLVNRDANEVESVRSAFPELVKEGSLVHLNHPDLVEKYFVDESSPPILMIVGAIPAITPTTKEERMVYTIASSLFTLPYLHKNKHDKGQLPFPTQRVFLEMAYKPRLTTMLQVAAAHKWHTVDGTQALIEQAYAQSRLWFTGSVDSNIGSDSSILGVEVENHVRTFMETQADVE